MNRRIKYGDPVEMLCFDGKIKIGWFNCRAQYHHDHVVIIDGTRCPDGRGWLSDTSHGVAVRRVGRKHWAEVVNIGGFQAAKEAQKCQK